MIDLSDSGLIHGRFRRLTDKLALVKTWPDIANCFAESDFTRAVEEASDSGVLPRFEIESSKNPLLDPVVTVYRSSIFETFSYARERLRKVFGRKYKQQWEFFAQRRQLEKELFLAEGVPEYRSCIKIDVVDLGAHFSQGVYFEPLKLRGEKPAHVQVLLAGAQDPEWVRQMDPSTGVPYVLMGGYSLRSGSMEYLPRLIFARKERWAVVNATMSAFESLNCSLPTLL